MFSLKENKRNPSPSQEWDGKSGGRSPEKVGSIGFGGMKTERENGELKTANSTNRQGVLGVGGVGKGHGFGVGKVEWPLLRV